MGTGHSTSHGSCRSRLHIGYACRLARSQACNRARTWCQVLSGMSANANWIRRSRHTSVAVNRPGIASRRPGSQTVCCNLSLNAASSVEVNEGTNLASKILSSIAMSATTQGIWKPLPMNESEQELPVLAASTSSGSAQQETVGAIASRATKVSALHRPPEGNGAGQHRNVRLLQD